MDQNQRQQQQQDQLQEGMYSFEQTRSFKERDYARKESPKFSNISRIVPSGSSKSTRFAYTSPSPLNFPEDQIERLKDVSPRMFEIGNTQINNSGTLNTNYHSSSTPQINNQFQNNSQIPSHQNNYSSANNNNLNYTQPNQNNQTWNHSNNESKSSQAYIQAMRALQIKIKTIEGMSQDQQKRFEEKDRNQVQLIEDLNQQNFLLKEEIVQEKHKNFQERQDFLRLEENLKKKLDLQERENSEQKKKICSLESSLEKELGRCELLEKWGAQDKEKLLQREKDFIDLEKMLNFLNEDNNQQKQKLIQSEEKIKFLEQKNFQLSQDLEKVQKLQQQQEQSNKQEKDQMIETFKQKYQNLSDQLCIQQKKNDSLVKEIKFFEEKWKELSLEEDLKKEENIRLQAEVEFYQDKSRNLEKEVEELKLYQGSQQEMNRNLMNSLMSIQGSGSIQSLDQLVKNKRTLITQTNKFNEKFQSVGDEWGVEPEQNYSQKNQNSFQNGRQFLSPQFSRNGIFSGNKNFDYFQNSQLNDKKNMAYNEISSNREEKQNEEIVRQKLTRAINQTSPLNLRIQENWGQTEKQNQEWKKNQLQNKNYSPQDEIEFSSASSQFNNEIFYQNQNQTSKTRREEKNQVNGKQRNISLMEFKKDVQQNYQNTQKQILSEIQKQQIENKYSNIHLLDKKQISEIALQMEKEIIEYNFDYQALADKIKCKDVDEVKEIKNQMSQISNQIQTRNDVLYKINQNRKKMNQMKQFKLQNQN